MRVILMHNPKAGSGEHDRKELLGLLKRAGHEAFYQSTKAKKYQRALDRGADAVLIAGGDGTVAKVARHLLGRDLPFSILSLGTANNLARTFGFHRMSARRVIAGLAKARSQKFDALRASGPWGERHLFEAVGAGVLPDYLNGAAHVVKAENENEEPSKNEEMARHVAVLRHVLEDYRPRKIEMELDGKDISGRYLLLEAMNIRSIGPVLQLAPNARTNDGRLNFVAVREDEREVLLDYLKKRLTSKTVKFPIAARTGRKWRLNWRGGPLHLDDEVWPQKKKHAKKRGQVEVVIEPGALNVLVPSPA